MSQHTPTLLEFDATDPVALTQALVRCASVTPADGGALDDHRALSRGSADFGLPGTVASAWRR